ncbi:hypothetical protein HPP92_013199 [Vanilla planifolia]|uniref:Uncharacterized protein n=1 Tax=Vanilla planifolia TaxID=51239 RepID=A0A835UZS4_VANPL|nr:hypothetical protein HPP92_013199 [Vanilla planifolia]
MEVAKKHRGSVAEPDHYVAALNKALDKSAEEIRVTASVNPTFWPAPELDLLDQCSSEGIMARHCLPSLGWSSPYRIIPVVRAIESCKLPDFPDLSWLKRGSRTGKRLINQDVSKAYVLAEKDSFMAMDVTRNPESASQLVYGGFKECPSNSCFEDLSFHSEVSLDELIEMCCVDTFEKSSLVTITTTPRAGDEAGDNGDASMLNQPDKHPLCSDSDEISGLLEANANIAVPLPSKNDRLTSLLERCRTLQDMIDQKLAIYF